MANDDDDVFVEDVGDVGGIGHDSDRGFSPDVDSPLDWHVTRVRAWAATSLGLPPAAAQAICVNGLQLSRVPHDDLVKALMAGGMHDREAASRVVAAWTSIVPGRWDQDADEDEADTAVCSSDRDRVESWDAVRVRDWAILVAGVSPESVDGLHLTGRDLLELSDLSDAKDTDLGMKCSPDTVRAILEARDQSKFRISRALVARWAPVQVAIWARSVLHIPPDASCMAALGAWQGWQLAYCDPEQVWALDPCPCPTRPKPPLPLSRVCVVRNFDWV